MGKKHLCIDSHAILDEGRPTSVSSSTLPAGTCVSVQGDFMVASDAVAKKLSVKTRSG